MLSYSVMSYSLQPPWTVARQVPMSMEILQARILAWDTTSSSGALPNMEIEPRSPALQADSLPPEPPEKNVGVM